MTDDELKAMIQNMADKTPPDAVIEPNKELKPNIGVLYPIGANPFKYAEVAQEDEEVTEDTLRRDIAVAVTKMHDCLGDRLESDLTLTDEYWSLRDRVHILQGQLKTLLDVAGPEYKKGPE